MDPAPVAPPRAAWLGPAAVAYLVVVLAIALAGARPLGHDEAVYALGARSLLAHEPALPLHRSIGMVVLDLPGVWLGGSELAVRLPFAVIALGYLALLYRIARRGFGADAAALAVAVQVINPEFSWRAGEALSDIPAAACLLAVVAALTTPRPRPVVAGVAAAAACYVRYASAPVVAVILAVVLLTHPAARRATLAAGAVALALLVPFFAWSHAATGSMFGVLEESQRMARRDYPGQGAWFYLRAWPVTLAGPVAGAVAAVGAAVAVAAWWRRRTDDAGRLGRLLGAVAIGQLGLLGWRVHGEARFVTLAVTALVAVGAGWLAGGPAWRRRAAVALVVAGAVPSAAWTTIRVRRLGDERAAIVAAARAIAVDRGDARCVVYATEAPIAAWYSGCRAQRVDGWGPDPAAAVGVPRVYLADAVRLRYHATGWIDPTDARFGWRPVPTARPTEAWAWRATVAIAPSP
ncbi:MAG: glycosyltransferase family 39 protein [Kofleriaceae bacterium]